MSSTVRSFDEWAAARSQTLPLSSLKGAVVGIEAFHYLDLHLNHYSTKEPLLIALGGFPFALKSNIEKEIQTLKSLGITCLFVFSGLDFGKKEHTFSAQTESSRALDQAWNFYDNQQADQVVDAFSAAGELGTSPPHCSSSTHIKDHLQEAPNLNRCTSFFRGFFSNRKSTISSHHTVLLPRCVFNRKRSPLMTSTNIEPSWYTSKRVPSDSLMRFSDHPSSFSTMSIRSSPNWNSNLPNSHG